MAALPATLIWECRTTGAATNGGGFNPGASGSDFSQQAGAQYTTTTATSAGAGNTILWAAAAADMVGNLVYAASGTNVNVGRYMIESVVVGVSITCSTNAAGTSIASGAVANGALNVGGAVNVGAATDDALFEGMIAGNLMYVKAGTYATMGSTISIARSGTTFLSITIEGYNTTRGDRPFPGVTAQPIWTMDSSGFVTGPLWLIRNMELVAPATVFAATLSLGSRSRAIECKVRNTNNTATPGGVIIPGNQSAIIRCDIQGTSTSTGIGGAFTPAGPFIVDSCYIHDVYQGINHGGSTTGFTVINNIFRNCVQYSLNIISSMAAWPIARNNTFYNYNRTGTGLNFASGSNPCVFSNNTISGFSVGANHAVGTMTSELDEYNNYYDNANDVTGSWTKGSNDIAVDPGFSGMSVVTGSNGVTNGVTFTSSGATFLSADIVPGRDFLTLISGTNSGLTFQVGCWPIVSVDSNTQLTLAIDPGTEATADKVYHIGMGANFAPGTNLSAAGNPGAFAGNYTEGFLDIGAVQIEPDSGVPRYSLDEKGHLHINLANGKFAIKL